MNINRPRRQVLNTLGKGASLSVAATFGLSAATGSAFAQAAYPAKPVKIIIPFPPGGTTDIVGRIMAQAMTQSLGQSVVVENRGGGGGTIGAAEIARSAPDGYVIGMGSVSTLGTAPSTFKKLAYDPRKDFTPIAQVAAVPGIIAVHPSFPARNYAEFIKVLKANPGKYNYASSGAGGVGHMGMELFKSKAGVFMTHIGYRGAGPALTDVLGGSVPIIWDNLSSTLPHVKSGKLIGIALAYDKRIPQLPDLPTFSEAGLKDYEATTWFGIIAPAGVPPEIVSRLNTEINKILQQPDVAKRFEDSGAFPMGGSSATMKTAIDKEVVKWAAVVKFANYTPE